MAGHPCSPAAQRPTQGRALNCPGPQRDRRGGRGGPRREKRARRGRAGEREILQLALTGSYLPVVQPRVVMPRPVVVSAAVTDVLLVSLVLLVLLRVAVTDVLHVSLVLQVLL